MKRLVTEWEKIFADHISDKRLLFGVHKDLETWIKKANHSITTWKKDTNRHFTEKNARMANKHMKRSTLLP